MKLFKFRLRLNYDGPEHDSLDFINGSLATQAPQALLRLPPKSVIIVTRAIVTVTMEIPQFVHQSVPSRIGLSR